MRKIFKKIIILILFFIPLKSFAISTPIENVFKDIDKNYKYYNELQTLYDKGMFSPDEYGNFNPDKLLKRDEFVGIMSEVSCKKCIKPNVSYEYLAKYHNFVPFFDVKKENKYFYCISSAKDLGQIKGYAKGNVCQNGVSNSNKTPFCPKNTIIREEALAMILRASNILSNAEANDTRKQIEQGVSFLDLSSDVKSHTKGGGVYSFYPDFQKALDYKIVEYDNSGNEKIYKLLELEDNKLNPKKEISKEEFLRMAYIALKASSCIEKANGDFGLKMKIFDKSCNKSKTNCTAPKNYKNETIFDFDGVVALTKGDSIDEKEGYSWRFYNLEDGTEIFKTGKYIDNYDFLKDGKYRVFLTAVSEKGYTATVYNDIYIGEKKDLIVSIDADPISGFASLSVNLKGIVYSSSPITSYFWEYGDSKTSYGIENTHIFKNPGIYEVKLTVKNMDGEQAEADSLIFVYDKNKDTDGDKIPDYKDKCPNIPGPKENDGCPIKCKKDNDCKDGFYCVNNICKIKDTDGDGVIDTDDKCPNIPGPKENDGCPIKCKKDSDCKDGFYCLDKTCQDGTDTDGDGVTDVEDKCPNIPGPKENDGCPYECEKDSDCENGFYCLDKTCQDGTDTDGDGVTDVEDKCPNISGPKENDGCPIIDDKCSKDSDCKKGFYCLGGTCEIKGIDKDCYNDGGDLIYGNVICEDCDNCNYSIDYNTTLRKCDIIFPAITSPNQKQIYSKGNYYQIIEGNIK